jgi:3-hydroxyisobutyrate dehydrogenase
MCGEWFESADVVLSCLPTSLNVAEAAHIGAERLRAQTLWIDCTSGSPELSAEIGGVLGHVDVDFVDAAISGGRRSALAGTLTAIVGGSRAHVNRAHSVLEAIASRIVHVGERAGSGHAVKAANNALLAANLVSASEMLATLAEQCGVEPHRALDAINHSSGRSFVTEQRFPEFVLTGERYGFTLELLRKDLAQAVDMQQGGTGDATTMTTTTAPSLLRSTLARIDGLVEADHVRGSSDHTDIYHAVVAERNALR